MRKTTMFLLAMAAGGLNGCFNEAMNLSPSDGSGASSSAGSGGTGDAGGSGGNAGTGAASGSGGTSGNGGSAGTGASSGSGGSGGQECSPGTTASCTTSCGSTGVKGCALDGTWSDCVPPAESCNSQDDDCDNAVDDGGVCDGTPCTPGQTAKCGTACGSIGDTVCGPDHQWGTCVPPIESCANAVDDNCNGLVNENCDPNAPGTEITYRYTAPANLGTPSGLSVHDEADDADDQPLPRPAPFGNTLYDTHYAWGIATDGPNGGCVAANASMLECKVHRPSGARMRANAHLQFTDQPAVWACSTMADPVTGTFEVYVEEQPATWTKEGYPGQPNGPGCRFFFVLP